MKNDLIKELLNQGLTPDEIHEKAIEVEKELAATREKEKAGAQARVALIKAIDEYMSIVYGKHLGVEWVKTLEKDLTLIEKGFYKTEDYNVGDIVASGKEVHKGTGIVLIPYPKMLGDIIHFTVVTESRQGIFIVIHVGFPIS